MKCIFILQVASHARYWRRIDMITELGVTAKVFAFEREYYKGNKESKIYTSLGSVQRENYARRIVPLLKAVMQIRDGIKDTDVIYTFGLDTFFIGYLSSLFQRKKVKFVYEVGDIRKVFTKNGVVGKFFRLLEKFVLRKAYLVVVTSEAFINEYFKGIQRVRNVKYHVIENKPELNELFKEKQARIKGENAKIKIGYFGVLRCLRSWEILKDLLEKYPDKFELYIRGLIVEPKTIEEECNRMSNVQYDGTYVVPNDLNRMYNQIDIVWACYPYQGKQLGNWCWAKTTRFYEACFFQKPMITQAGTQDASVVSKYNVGIELDLSDVISSVERLCHLDNSRLRQMENNYKHVPMDLFTYNNEHEKLVAILEEKI